MQYRVMPRNGDKLSVLGFGCMRFQTQDGKIDEPRAIAQVRHAIGLGVNYMDTAWPYHGGQSEPLLGRALADGYREKVKVATKLPTWLVKTRGDMDRFLNEQLKRLATDHIDYYLLHGLNGDSWDGLARLDVLDFLERAKADGRIVNAGFSFHGQLDDFKRIVDASPWVFCQIQHNYFDQEFQAGTEGLRYAAGRGLGVIVMEPLRGGNLARPVPPPAVAALWEQAAQRRTPAERALRWVWNHPEVTLLLSGMNDEAQIDENIAVAETALPNSLDAAELELIDRAAAQYKALTQVNCTGCGYCMPCVSGVMIPVCFEEWNKLHMFGGGEDAKFAYAMRTANVFSGGPEGFASQCVQCEACLEKCPQHIPIPDMLAKAAAEMEDGGFRERVATARKMFA